MFIDLGKGEEKDRQTWMSERNIDWLPPVCALTADRTHNLVMCPDQESNLQTFGAQDDAPTD